MSSKKLTYATNGDIFLQGLKVHIRDACGGEGDNGRKGQQCGGVTAKGVVEQMSSMADMTTDLLTVESLVGSTRCRKRA